MNEWVCKRRLGDALQHRDGRGRLQPSATRLGVLASNSFRSTCSPSRKVVSPGVGDLDLLQHLAHDHFDVLVVDLHALQAIDLLDFVDQVLGQRLDAHDAQDVVRTGIAVHQEVALLHEVAFLNGCACPSGSGIRPARRPRPSARSMMRRLFL